MSAPKNTGKGRAYLWLTDHVSYPHDYCLIWPFATSRGYGHFGYLGKKYYAHRFMCELAHGPAPSDIHEAAHSCGNNVCANPNHLSWKTPTENMLDCREHGTHIRSRWGASGKITEREVQEIRALRATKGLRELADQYGVSESTISNICVGRTHAHLNNAPPLWTSEEDEQLKEAIRNRIPLSKAAIAFERRSYKSIAQRARLLGINTGRPISPAEGAKQP